MTKLQADARWSLRPDYSGRPPRVPLPSASHRGRGEGWVRGGGQLSPPRFKRGQALVEFALMFPIVFFLLALTIDLFRVDWVTTTVAEAARQGARQAVANADPYDNPFGTAGGACSGTTQVNAANGSGCLTSGRIYQTVTNVLGGFSTGSPLTQAFPANCPNPSRGHAPVCGFPPERGPPPPYLTSPPPPHPP